MGSMAPYVNSMSPRGLDVVIGGQELTSEDRVEVDGSTGDNIVPFHIWELWKIR